MPGAPGAAHRGSSFPPDWSVGWCKFAAFALGAMTEASKYFVSPAVVAEPADPSIEVRKRLQRITTDRWGDLMSAVPRYNRDWKTRDTMASPRITVFTRAEPHSELLRFRAMGAMHTDRIATSRLHDRRGRRQVLCDNTHEA